MDHEEVHWIRTLFVLVLLLSSVPAGIEEYYLEQRLWVLPVSFLFRNLVLIEGYLLSVTYDNAGLVNRCQCSPEVLYCIWKAAEDE